jgi:hypothetical protein
MYEQKMMALSDLDETNFSLEQKVLASSIETYFRQEHGRKQRATPSSVGSASRRRRCSPPPTLAEEVNSQTLHSNSTVPPIVLTSTSTAHHVAAAASSSSSIAYDTNGDTTSIAAIDNVAPDEEYPQVVQELVMNGFELQDVVRAYEFVGDRFDDMLSFLLSLNKSS